MNRWLYLLLLAAPAAVLADVLHASPLLTFVLAALGIVPLAGLIGQSTEVLAEHLGQRRPPGRARVIDHLLSGSGQP